MARLNLTKKQIKLITKALFNTYNEKINTNEKSKSVLKDANDCFELAEYLECVIE